MAISETCAQDPSIRLVENYHRCLEQRLEVWFGPGVTILHDPEQLTFDLEWNDQQAKMQFLPRLCRWTLRYGDIEAEGNFDRVSKRLRQCFSGLAKPSQS